MKYMSCIVVLFLLGSAFAETVGDLSSNENDLSWMISVSRSWDGTNPDLNGQLTDTLPCDVRATVTFKSGTYAGGIYRGWLHKGDFVFYQVDEVIPCTGERRRIIRAGRCGNPATGTYFIPKPKPPEQPPPPCEPPPCKEPPPRPQPPPIICPAPQPPPIVKVTVEAPECPTPPAQVVNNYITCPEPAKPLPRQPHAGAQKVRYRIGTATYLVAGYVHEDICRQPPPKKKCTDFPDPNRPIIPPPAPPDPGQDDY